MFLCEGTDTIYPGKCLYSSRNQDNYLKSPNGQYRVYMQGNGDVVLYKCVDGYQPLWKSNTRKNYPAEPYRLCMDRNDKLVAYDRYDRKVWDNQVGSKNGWASGGRAKIRNDGNFVVYDKNWKIFTDTSEKPKAISCLDGIRVLSILLVMFGHMASNYSYAPVNNK